MIRVVLVDDHDMVRSALARVVDSQSDLEVVAQAANAEDAWEAMRSTAVDVVITDLDLPGESGRQLALKILEQHPNQAIVVLSYRVDPSEVHFLMESGVRVYVPKTASSEELLRAIREVAHGGHYFANQAASALAEATRNRGNGPPSPLSLRQLLILQHMSKGVTTREIASILCLSPKTVEKYRSEILRRLECKNQVQAIEVARRLQILDSPNHQPFAK